jgi:hypothetical protein
MLSGGDLLPVLFHGKEMGSALTADGRTKRIKHPQGNGAAFSDKGEARHVVEEVWEKKDIRALPATKTRFHLSESRSVPGQRRRHFSKSIAVPALLYMSDSLTLYTGTTLEISLGGIRVSVPHMRNKKDFLVGSLISVVFTLPGGRNPTTMQCVVHHARLRSSGDLIIEASFLITFDFGSFLNLQDYLMRGTGER